MTESSGSSHIVSVNHFRLYQQERKKTYLDDISSMCVRASEDLLKFFPIFVDDYLPYGS